MKGRRRRRMGPVQQQSAAYALILVGALATGLGALYRVSAGPGESASGGYLVETLGLFLAVAGAVWQARVSDMLVVFEPKSIRSRAILSLLAGICMALLGCVAASTIETDRHDATLRAFTEGGIVGGVGLGLAGFLSLLWAFGLGYAGERIEHLSEEDW